MAKVKFNLKTFCDEHIPAAIKKNTQGNDPLTRTARTGALNGYSAFMSIAGGLLDTDIEFDLPFDLPGGPAVPQVQPIDPADALNDIAKALKQAETTLLGENLSIHSASVDVELTVAIAGAAGASAKFNLQIGPTPTD